MHCKARVNPRVDMNFVDQFGFVDIYGALSTGNISGAISAGEAQFDSSDNFSPKAILGRATDFFEACEMSDNLKSAAAAAEAAKAAKEASATSSEAQ